MRRQGRRETDYETYNQNRERKLNEKETKMTDKKIRQRWKNDKIVQNA